MKIQFSKYQGTGNDFILIDNRSKKIILSAEQIKSLCHRRFGIGADGLMLLEPETGFDFKMVYYNSDGNQSSMCGNGGRCISAFAKRLGLVGDKANFLAIDGPHESIFFDNSVKLRMNDVNGIEKIGNDFYLNTGSPHYVRIVSDLDSFNVVEEGKKIRYNERFKEKGTNVNFIEKKGNKLHVRTYERGVEDETYSCGTGVTASALISSVVNMFGIKDHCDIITSGGNLSVSFKKVSDQAYTDIWLEGPAEFVFEGSIEV
ncbi:MAG: diaminopimelate epimerase [Bacteroidota bacterium]|nr:diaminopimelate epimerase [Bacteroidota bacterium]